MSENAVKLERLYLSPFRYAQAWAVEKLREYIESKGGVITNSDPKEINIWGGNYEEPTEELKRTHPTFVSHCFSWCGWTISFDYEGFNYCVSGNDNPFFPVYIHKEPIGDKYRRYGDEFKAFSFHGYKDRLTDYSKENPEEEFTPQIFEAIISAPISQPVVKRKRRYWTQIEYEMKGDYR